MALHPPIDEPAEVVREALAPLRSDFSVALWAPGNPFAVGAVIRVAHSFLARQIVVVGSAPFYAKASMGMQKYEKIVQASDTADFFRLVAGMPVWAVEKDAARSSVYAVKAFPRDVVFVFGSERFGLPPEVVARADQVVGIPLYGINQSLPVVVAAGIVMSEWARRRYAPGAIV
jgi:tRNA G18 (ribose-2'-O)-methylase SpoU